MSTVRESTAFASPHSGWKAGEVRTPVTTQPPSVRLLANAPRSLGQKQTRASFGSVEVAAVAAAAVVAMRSSRRSKRTQNSRPRMARCAVTGVVDKENPLRVIVAGGGVGGLMTAKALTKIPNVEVTMLEQAAKFGKFGGPIQLASNALSTIKQIDEELFYDLMSKFTFTGNRRNGLVDGLRTEWYCPFEAMKTSADMFDLPYTGVVDRPDLQDVLMKSLPEGLVVNGKKVTGYEILPNHQGVRVTCMDGTVTEGDVLIGADGIWSACRAQMWGEERQGPKSGCTYSGYIVFAGETVYQPEDYFEVGYKVYMGPKRYFVCSDVGRGRIQWYAFCAVPEGTEFPEDPEEKKKYITTAFFGWSPQVLELMEATPASTIEDRALYDRPPSFFKSWADGPVALMGDAVHPMMPNLGQGGCQAMEDGYVIAEKLRQVRHRQEIPDVLQDYYRTRIFRTATVQFLSRIASDLLLDTFTFPWKPAEGFSAPYGQGFGDFNYNAVVVNYLRYLLPTIFVAQFTFLYSFHPFKWTHDEVEQLVQTVMDRHKVDAHAAWDKRMDAVSRGEQDDSGAGVPSFFAKVKTY